MSFPEDKGVAVMSGEQPLLQPGQNCWRVVTASRFAFIVDADEYFVALRKAMLAARRSIFLIGWDFDARVRLAERHDEGPEALGDFVLWLAQRSPALDIRLLRWDTGAIRAVFRGSTLWTLLRWKMHKRITLKLDSKHPLASAHHQKIVVVDDCLAFCGGIDVTIGRWDRRAHEDDDPQRVGPNGEPQDPWHDATSAFAGDAARAMGELARKRWEVATGESLPAVQAVQDCWPENLSTTFEQVSLGISRTHPKMDGVEPVHEIEQAYLDLIACASRVIYAESQYFASPRIAKAMARRLSEEQGPEIIIVNPVSALGWLEPIAMDSARGRLVEALRRADRHGRLRIYHPKTAGGNDIYVHAKVMVVDDRYLRVGSSNFNNRSLRFDTECDVILAADEPRHASHRARIASLRNDLLAEHLDTTAERVATELEKSGSLIAVIERMRLQHQGQPRRTLVPFVLPELNDIEEWLADNEILDPEGPDAIFEPLSKRGLFKHWQRPFGKRR